MAAGTHGRGGTAARHATARAHFRPSRLLAQATRRRRRRAGFAYRRTVARGGVGAQWQDFRASPMRACSASVIALPCGPCLGGAPDWAAAAICWCSASMPSKSTWGTRPQ